MYNRSCTIAAMDLAVPLTSLCVYTSHENKRAGQRGRGRGKGRGAGEGNCLGARFGIISDVPLHTAELVEHCQPTCVAECLLKC